MPQQSPADILAKAKSVAAHAESAFPSKLSKAATVTPAAAVKTAPAVNLGTELAAKKAMIDKAGVTAPKMHKGGSVSADGNYSLKKGEHVLTGREAKRLRMHAALLAGIGSLAKESKPSLKKGA